MPHLSTPRPLPHIVFLRCHSQSVRHREYTGTTPSFLKQSLYANADAGVREGGGEGGNELIKYKEGSKLKGGQLMPLRSTNWSSL